MEELFSNKKYIFLFVMVLLLFILLFFSEDSVRAENIDYFSQLGISKPTSEIDSIDFFVESLDGVRVRLHDFRGKVVFLNFWATTCGPCRAEVRDIHLLHQTLKNEPFVIMAVDIKEDINTIKKFMKKNNIDFPVYLDKSGEIAIQYAIIGIPTTYIINPEGKIVGRAIGPRPWGSEQSIKFMRSLMK